MVDINGEKVHKALNIYAEASRNVSVLAGNKLEAADASYKNLIWENQGKNAKLIQW